MMRCKNISCQKKFRITKDLKLVRIEAITKTKKTHILYDKVWCPYCGTIN